jgi:hypothetical protein
MDTANETKPGLSADPCVIVDFVFDRGLLSISIKNIGTLPAYDVQVEFSHQLKGRGGDIELSELPLFRDLAFLPGGKEIGTFLDTSASYFQSRQPTQINLFIKWKAADGASFQTTIRHNLEIYRDIAYTGRRPAEP